VRGCKIHKYKFAIINFKFEFANLCVIFYYGMPNNLKEKTESSAVSIGSTEMNDIAPQ
jgi:hypothetical protein